MMIRFNDENSMVRASDVREVTRHDHPNLDEPVNYRLSIMIDRARRDDPPFTITYGWVYKHERDRAFNEIERLCNGLPETEDGGPGGWCRHGVRMT